MTEANFSFTTKIGNDLFTVRGMTYDEFLQNAVAAGSVHGIGNLIAALNGELVAEAEQHVVGQVVQAFNGAPVSSQTGAVAGDPFGGSFAPVAPAPTYAAPSPVPPTPGASAGDRHCNHGVMIKRTGVGTKGEWRAWFCPTPKGTENQCKPVFADKRNPAEWSAF